MEEEENMLPPFWLQTNDTLRQVDHRRRRHLLRRSTSIFLNSSALVAVLLVIALVFIFIIIPTLLSFTSHVFRPQLVKKSWDSLNLVLVLFAIVCGFLSRNSNENTNSYEDQSVSIAGSGASKSNPSTPRQWYENQYSDRTAYMTRLRSSSSYPDLRQESNWASRDDRWRSYDDIHVNSYHADQGLHHRRPWPQEPEPEQEAVVDRNLREEGSYSQPAPPSQSSSSPPETPPPRQASPPRPVTPPQPSKKVGVKRKPKRSDEALGENERISTGTDFEAIVEISYPPPSAIPIPIQTPPPAPISVYEETERKSSGKNEKKRGVVSKEFLISSLRRKKKKQRQKSVENFDAIIMSSVPSSSSSSSLLLTAPPSRAPSPPPPPPPSSAFHNLFSSKKGKTKKSISQPQPPSQPPPPSRKHTSMVSASKTKPSSPIRARRFPLPETTTTSIGTSSIGVEYDNVNRGNESPLIPIPPPPPPPPFKMPAWKFVRHGDFVRINSNNSSRSGSPDLDDSEDSGSMETSPLARNGAAMEVGESSTAMFCPSPDVDSKADTFIARFRAGLKLEKMNSAKERKSTLGPQ